MQLSTSTFKINGWALNIWEARLYKEARSLWAPAWQVTSAIACNTRPARAQRDPQTGELLPYRGDLVGRMPPSHYAVAQSWGRFSLFSPPYTQVSTDTSTYGFSFPH